MISSNQAMEQLERMSGMDYFPRGKDQAGALKELRSAVEAAATVQIAEAAVSAMVHYAVECPKPAQLRRAIWEMNEQLEKKVKDCPLCHGSGQQTVWILTTYNGRSYTVKKQEILAGFSPEKAAEFAKKLRYDDGPITPNNPFVGDNQEIISGARPCACGRYEAQPDLADSIKARRRVSAGVA
jgi:hypothetical protein